MRQIEQNELAPLATGAWILGTGGGGSPYLSYLNMRQIYADGTRVSLMDPADLADDALVAVVSNMGAPLVGQERLSDPAFAAKPVRMMEAYLGRRFTAVMSVEIGGGNAFQPLLVAAMTGLPVVDADAMGRAFPEAQMTSFAIADLPMFPLTLADIRDNEVIVARAASWKWMERISRKACTELGSIAATCKAPRTGAEVKAYGILYTTSQAIALGQEVRRARHAHEDPVAATLQAASGKLLFRGKIADVQRRATEGFLRGNAVIEGIDADRGSRFEVAFQNEYAIGWRDGRVSVTTPDLICLLDSVSGEAIGTESLRYGQRVSVIALPCPPILRTPEGHRACRPQGVRPRHRLCQRFRTGERMTMRRIGIDVGGTNTDAVLIDGNRVVASVKTTTTADVLSGVRSALAALLAHGDPGKIGAVVIGTTHFTNAVIERRSLQRVGALRIGLPASASLPPFIDWPEDLAAIVRGQVHMVAGGHEYDGRPIVPLDLTAIRDAARRMADAGLTSVGVTSIFSPLTAECEREAQRILREEMPGASITLSHELGRIGLLERENVTLLNACLQDLARTTVAAFIEALQGSAITAPLYLTQNDGTIMRAGTASRFPVFSFASGPTNSMRGAAFLSGQQDGVVVDVGGTTTDVGYLKGGFPREANAAVEIGGVRTLFRMPDLLSIGLGGGTRIEDDRIGPRSVGFRLLQESLVFGGNTLTATDIACAAGRIDLGDRSLVAGLPEAFVDSTLVRIAEMITEAVDRMKTEAGDVRLLAVGGGSFLIPDQVEGCSEVIRVEHHAVANAVGAAIAQASGEVDQIFSNVTRDQAIAAATAEAETKAVAAGAARSSLKLVEMEDIPLSYLPGDARRVRIRIVGDIDAGETSQ